MLTLPPTTHRLLPLLLFALAAPLAAGEVDLRAPDEIRALLQPYLPEDTPSPRRLRDLLGDILATEGYFSPHFEFGETADPLRLTLTPGPRTLISEVTLAFDGPIAEETRASLLGSWRLPVGQPFRQADWNDAKQKVLADLLAVDHGAARLLDTEAEIDTATHSARLRAHYDAGPRYRFGALHIEGLRRYSPELVSRYNRSAPIGAPYREDKLNTLQTTLQTTPYFASVQAALDLTTDNESNADGTVSAPLLLRVREQAPHRIAFGVGASSNTGARVEFNYHTPDAFNRAWALHSGLRLEEKKQTAYTDIFLPPTASSQHPSFGLMLENTDIQGLRTERYAFGAQSIQWRGNVEQHLSLGWQDERRWPDGAWPTTSRALVPNAMLTWRHVDKLLDPRDGIVLQAQIGGGAKAALSDQDFIRLHARYQQFIPLGRANTLSLRGEIGYTHAASRQGIPQDYLFRTGGTGTVRGYTYQSLGIHEGSAIVGGRYLAVASGEITHWLNESWGMAGFADIGDAIDHLPATRPALGYGVGARWRSPAGPIGADLAYGERTGHVQLHFSLAIPF